VTQLRKMMLEELQRRNYSQTTVNTYLKVVEDFARHFGSPAGIYPRTTGALRHAHKTCVQTLCKACLRCEIAPSRNSNSPHRLGHPCCRP
jgi:hypothetical protein